MPPAIIILGPSKWVADADPDRVVAGTPLDVRREIARRIRRPGVQALLLEDEDKRSDEDNFAFFLRVTDERDVRTFVLFWPLGARLHGLDVEVGHLLTRLSDGQLEPHDVYLLAEKRGLGIESRDGAVAWKEPKNRTRYHEDLVARGCPVRRWSSPGSLWAHAGSISWEHRQRYRL